MSAPAWAPAPDSAHSPSRSPSPTPTPPPAAISEESRLRIERNRQQALERLRLSRELKLVPPASPLVSPPPPSARAAASAAATATPLVAVAAPREAPSLEPPPEGDSRDEGKFSWSCENLLDSGRVCGGNHDRQLKEQFGEVVCFKCKSETNDYECISKEAVKRDYLLPEASFKSLQFLLIPNPMNARWAHIKLYLRRHCKECAVRRWGSAAALQSELRLRETQRYDKSVARTQALFESEASPSDGTDKRNTLLNKGKKRKASEIAAMAAIIRGKD
jgi:hypothetical protein